MMTEFSFFLGVLSLNDRIKIFGCTVPLKPCLSAGDTSVLMFLSSAVYQAETASNAAASFQMESACVSIHEALKSVIDYQTHFRLREAQGRSRAEDLNTRVAFWSIGEAFILLVVSISQVLLLRSFFSDKKTTTTRVGS